MVEMTSSVKTDQFCPPFQVKIKELKWFIDVNQSASYIMVINLGVITRQLKK
jgi:hypothetical protein